MSGSPARKATRKKEWREEAWRRGRVTVEVLGARGLPPSDPVAAVRLVDVVARQPLAPPLDTSVRTSVVKNTKEPEWSDEKFLFDGVGPALPYVRVQLLDYNGPRHRPRLLGAVDVSLEALQRLGGAHGSVAAQWYPLKVEGEERGAVSLKVDLLPLSAMEPKALAIRDALESRWFPDIIGDDLDELAEEKAPNCLKVAVVRAKDLRPVDDGTIGRHQSNPLVCLDVVGAGGIGAEVETLVEEDDCDPVWGSTLTAPLPVNVDVKTMALRVRVLDVDEDRITSRKLMGCCAFRLDRLPSQLEEDGSSVATWYALTPGPDDIDDDDRGEILLACRLVHEPSLLKVDDTPFFSEEAIDDEMLNRAPNEVRVAVLRCEALHAPPTAAWRPLQRTVTMANPYVSVSVEPGDGFVQKTRTMFADLNPIFDEAFAFEIDGEAVAEAEDNTNTCVVADCFARDGVDGLDAFIGRARMPLGALAREPGQVGRAWVPLLDERDQIRGRCLMEAQCVWDASHIFAPFDVSQDRDLGPFPPNELSVAVFRARGVPPPPPKSYDRFDRKEVAIELTVPGLNEPLQIGARQRTGAPLWRAVQTVELSAPDEYSTTPQNNWESLQEYEIGLTLKDHSVLGKGAVPLANLCDSLPRRTFSGWVALRAPDGAEADVHLDKWRCGVFVALHWSHNPVLHYEPFSPNQDENVKQHPNELCVAIVRARGLKAPDGEACASVLLAVPTADGEDVEHEVETQPRQGSDPAWKEAFFLGLEDPFLRKHPPIVQLGVRSRGLSLGRGDLPLRLGLDRKVHTEWVSLQDDGYSVGGGAVEVRFMLRYNEALDRFHDPHVKDRLAAQKAVKSAQSYLLQLEEERERRTRIDEALKRDSRMAAAACERARVYLEELDEARKESLPDALKGGEKDDGIYRECAAGLAHQVRAYLEKAEREGRLRQALNERGSSRGRNLLHVAAINNRVACLDVLLHDFSAPCNPRSLLGRDTPLHLACQRGHRYACFLLCQAGADPTIQNKFGATPLHYCTKRSICRLLLRHGASILVRDSNGRTVLEAAEQNDAPEETLKEIQLVKAMQERARYQANLELDAIKLAKFNAAMAAREERATRAAKAAAIKAQRDDYMKWRRGTVTGNQVLAERTQRQRTEERWARMTDAKEIDPLQERKIEASRTMDGGFFAAGLASFTKGVWSGNDDAAQRDRKSMGVDGNAAAKAAGALAATPGRLVAGKL